MAQIVQSEVDGEQPAQPPLVPEGVTEVGIDEALKIAVQMQQHQQFQGAEELYRRILEAAPGHPDALCFLGMLRHELGRNDEAISLIGEAIAKAPGFAGYHNNLGNVLALNDRLDEAAASYRAAIAADPASAEPYNNLGVIYRALGRLDEARAQYEKTLEIDPSHVRAWNNLGLLHAAEDDLEGAVRCYVKALDLMPGNAKAADMLGMTYYKYGRIAEATEVYRQWHEREPDNPVAAHMYAACSGQDVPGRASDDYVETAFDRFASSFETVLNERLGYQAPALCAAVLAECLPAPARQFVMLDAGCGTGLCGPLMAPWAADLWGVDLSVGMLERARAKGTYHHLRKAELTAYLNGTPEFWDAIVSADTLCYFGDLAEVTQAAARALRPGGLLVYTVEALADDAADRAAIQPHGRYAHGRAHIERTLAAAGLELRLARREVLRRELGTEVSGWLVAARRAA